MINFDFFPSKRIACYMARMFILRSLAVLVMLVMVLMMLDLLGETGDILAGAGQRRGRAVALRLAARPAAHRPLPAFLGAAGTLITLATLNQNSEVISMKAAGHLGAPDPRPADRRQPRNRGGQLRLQRARRHPRHRTLSSWEKADYGPVPRDRASAPTSGCAGATT